MSPIKSPPPRLTFNQDRKVHVPASYRGHHTALAETEDSSSLDSPLQQSAKSVSDFSPRKSLFLQTQDTVPDDIDSDSLIALSPSLTDEDYNLFSLGETEGIANLFDDLF